jgi:signal recognition particle GTPase
MANTDSDKLDKIIRVVTRTEVQVEALMEADAHTRITRLEQAHKFWKALAIAVPSICGIVIGALRLLS